MAILLTFTRLFIHLLCSRLCYLLRDWAQTCCSVAAQFFTEPIPCLGALLAVWHSVYIGVLNLSQQICIFALQLVGCSWRKCHPVPLTGNIVYLSQTDLTPLFYSRTKSLLGVGLGMSSVFQTDAKEFIEPLFCPYHPKLILCRVLQLTDLFRVLSLSFSRLCVCHLALVWCLPK